MHPALAALVLRVRQGEARAARRRWLVDREPADFRQLRRDVPAVERAIVRAAEALPEGGGREALYLALADLLATLS